jgi:hypothetical protein
MAEHMLNMFKRKILQRIYGPIQEGDASIPDGIMNSTGMNGGVL